SPEGDAPGNDGLGAILAIQSRPLLPLVARSAGGRRLGMRGRSAEALRGTGIDLDHVWWWAVTLVDYHRLALQKWAWLRQGAFRSISVAYVGRSVAVHPRFPNRACSPHHLPSS